jgi:inhibitor of KinA
VSDPWTRPFGTRSGESKGRIAYSGDAAIVLELPARIDPAINERAVHLAQRIQTARHKGVRDVVTTYHTVAVYFDPAELELQRLADTLQGMLDEPEPERTPSTRTVTVPVCYGGELGPDLGAVAAFAHCREDEVVGLHAGREYRVFMLGFVPGFTYLGTVEPRIAMPRRATPRMLVTAGSVGIAGEQTGIYPSDTPGGWQIIGRTPLRMFDLSRHDPFLLRPGDTVLFEPVTPHDYARLASRASGGRTST